MQFPFKAGEEGYNKKHTETKYSVNFWKSFCYIILPFLSIIRIYLFRGYFINKN